MVKKAAEELKRAVELFNFESRQIDQQIEEALARGWTKKVERLAGRKKELEAKIAYCQELLTQNRFCFWFILLFPLY